MNEQITESKCCKVKEPVKLEPKENKMYSVFMSMEEERKFARASEKIIGLQTSLFDGEDA